MNKRDRRLLDAGTNKYSSHGPFDQIKKEKGFCAPIVPLYRLSTLKISVSKQSKAHRHYRTRKWVRRTRLSEGMRLNFKNIREELDRLSSLMDIPDKTKIKALGIYLEAAERSLVRGKRIEIIAAATLYAGCRRTNFSRTLKEFEEHSDLAAKGIESVYRYLSAELDIKLLPPSPDEYLDQFCSMLDLSPRTQKISKNILDEASKNGITSGKGPTGMAAASIYISSLIEDQTRTQKDIAEVAGVTEVTIRNRYKELVNKLNIDISEKRKTKSDQT